VRYLATIAAAAVGLALAGAAPATSLPTRVAAGPWIRLYAFRSTAVLNAQLQAVISLQSYATAVGDPSAAAVATRMQHAAAATVPRFDTGYWTYYSLARDPSPCDYQHTSCSS
jgi:D-glucuronyl C5-epimerase C-terminus